MIKRLLLILAAAFGFVVVGAVAANASENGHGHHQKAGHHKVVKNHHNVKPGHHQVKHHPNKPAPKPGCICKPKPTPPPGGWPCTHTHSCKPHKPHCGPGHKPPHHKPPHVKPPHHHKPPHVTPPPEKPPVHVVTHHKPPVHLTTVTTASVVPQLPRTGGFASQLLEIALILLLLGVGASVAGRRKPSSGRR